MVRIEKTSRGWKRLIADRRLWREDFFSIARTLRRVPFCAYKVGEVAARIARKRERIQTFWDGVETVNIARKGDFIVTNLGPDRDALRGPDGALNSYVIREERFAELYEPVGIDTFFGPAHRARGGVRAYRLIGGFDIVAPWGERMAAESGFLILNGDDVYGAHRDAFHRSYAQAPGRLETKIPVEPA